MLKTQIGLLPVPFVAVCLAVALTASAQDPDHPVITEVFTNPSGPGNDDGPVGRNPANDHQEFIEIYLPPASDLDPPFDADALNLTL